MVDPHANGCLEPEVLAAYVDRGLSLSERARVDEHLASCPQCVALVAGVARTVAEVSALVPGAAIAAEATPFVTRRAVAGGLAAAAAVFAVLITPSLVRPWLERDPGLVSLVDNVGGHRSVLGRLTGGLPHAPLGVPSAGGQDGRAAETDRVQLTAGKIRESFGERDTPSHLHALGVSQLLAGRYDDAAQSLLAASREQPANARYLSDVATVQLERARRGLRPDDLPRAFAAADRARHLDPSLREAWFNRALAASALSLTDYAKTAWTEYLARDNASPWAAEARTRLEELTRPTPAQAWSGIEAGLERTIDATTADEAVRAQTTEARNYIEQTLLVRWADAVLADGSGDAALARLRIMADAMARVAGDALYQDVVAAIDRAGAGAKALAATHRDFAAAARLLADDRFVDAAPGLTAVRAQFLSAGSPGAELAALGLGTVAYVSNNYAEADRVLALVQTAGQAKGYAYAAGRASWLRGLMAFTQGRLGEAQVFYEDSLAVFDRMGDVEQSGAVHNLLSGVAFQLGDPVTEWRHRWAAFNALTVSRSPRFKYSTLASAAISARVVSPEVALAIQQVVVASAKEWGREGAIADALAQRSSTLLSLGRTTEAAADITEARQRVQRVPDPGFRAMLELPVLAAESDLRRESDPSQAAAAAQQAIDTIQARRDRARLPQFMLRLAKANIVWGNLAAAERALAEGIQAFDETRAKPAGVNIAAFDESWQLFESAMRIAIRKGDRERAFAMAERARPTHNNGPAQPVLSLVAAQGLARPDEAIVALNQFEDELAVWIIRHDRTSLVMRPIRRIDAERLVARQQEEIRIEARRPDASASLFDAILRPLAAELRGVSRIAFVPDSTYQAASFAAFWDRSKSRFLVEDITIASAPNVSVLAMSGGERRAVIGDPLIVAGDAQEPTARAIASAYRTPQVLTGASATRERFLADAPKSNIVHLTVPAHPNVAFPSLSRIVLSDEPGKRYSGAVLGHDIASRPMPATRLVVLDDVRNSDSYRREGSFNLARAFLAAGVPAVLGTLPGADESKTRELMVAFHRQLAGEASAVDTLTRLQRNVLRSNGRRIGAWSALVMYGSDR